MVKKEKVKSHSGLIAFLLIIILLLSFTLFVVLFPTKFINISGKTILNAIDLTKISEINNQIPETGNFFISVHYTDAELSKMIEDQLKKNFHVEDAAVVFNNNNTIDLALTSGDVQTLFAGQSIPSFLLKIFSSRNIYTNISISLDSESNLLLIVNEAYIDDLAIPASLFDTMTSDISAKIKEGLNLIDGFELQSVSMEGHMIKIDGVIRNN